jgi:hypothetical protein
MRPLPEENEDAAGRPGLAHPCRTVSRSRRCCGRVRRAWRRGDPARSSGSSRVGASTNCQSTCGSARSALPENRGNPAAGHANRSRPQNTSARRLSQPGQSVKPRTEAGHVQTQSARGKGPGARCPTKRRLGASRRLPRDPGGKLVRPPHGLLGKQGRAGDAVRRQRLRLQPPRSAPCPEAPCPVWPGCGGTAPARSEGRPPSAGTCGGPRPPAPAART